MTEDPAARIVDQEKKRMSRKSKLTKPRVPFLTNAMATKRFEFKKWRETGWTVVGSQANFYREEHGPDRAVDIIVKSSCRATTVLLETTRAEERCWVLTVNAQETRSPSQRHGRPPRRPGWRDQGGAKVFADEE